MNTARRWSFRIISSKIMMGLVLAAMIGSIDVTAANAKGEKNHGGQHDNGRKEFRGRGYDRGHDRRVYRSYGYRERVYVPPPVYFAPPPPPGIGIFFPSITIRP